MPEMTAEEFANFPAINPTDYVERPVSDTDAILSAIADVQATLNRYIELVEGMAEQVAPLMNSPMLRMFGGK